MSIFTSETQPDPSQRKIVDCKDVYHFGASTVNLTTFLDKCMTQGSVPKGFDFGKEWKCIKKRQADTSRVSRLLTSIDRQYRPLQEPVWAQPQRYHRSIQL